MQSLLSSQILQIEEVAMETVLQSESVPVIYNIHISSCATRISCEYFLRDQPQKATFVIEKLYLIAGVE